MCTADEPALGGGTCQGEEQAGGGGGDGGQQGGLVEVGMGSAWGVQGAMEACREISGTSLWQDGPSGSNMGPCVDKMFEELCRRVAPQVDLREEDGHRKPADEQAETQEAGTLEQSWISQTSQCHSSTYRMSGTGLRTPQTGSSVLTVALCARHFLGLCGPEKTSNLLRIYTSKWRSQDSNPDLSDSKVCLPPPNPPQLQQNLGQVPLGMWEKEVPGPGRWESAAP